MSQSITKSYTQFNQGWPEILKATIDTTIYKYHTSNANYFVTLEMRIPTLMPWIARRYVIWMTFFHPSTSFSTAASEAGL